MEQRVKDILKRVGRDPDAISKAYVKNFCKNARKITVCSLKTQIVTLYLAVLFNCLYNAAYVPNIGYLLFINLNYTSSLLSLF